MHVSLLNVNIFQLSPTMYGLKQSSKDRYYEKDLQSTAKNIMNVKLIKNNFVSVEETRGEKKTTLLT